MEYTKLGYRLEQGLVPGGIAFTCQRPTVGTPNGGWIVAQLIISAPTDREAIEAQLRHWVSYYRDPELAEQATKLLNTALNRPGSLPPVTPPPPPVSPAAPN